MVAPDYHPNTLKLRQEDCLDFEASLGYRGDLILKLEK